MLPMEINATQPWLISQVGNVAEVTGKFGGANQFRNLVNRFQALLYVAQ